MRKDLISALRLIEKYKNAKWCDVAPKQIHKCAVLGAGIMGAGIAKVFSAYGLPVWLKDLNYDVIDRGLKQAREVYEGGVKKKLNVNQPVFDAGFITPTMDYSGFFDIDLIVETVFEDAKIKKSVFSELNSVARRDAIVASNTSCLSISEISDGLKNTERICGMHFFNPVHRMPLVEVVRMRNTSDETIATITEFCKKLGKVPIVVKDCHGFLINRILTAYLSEAIFILEEGVDFERIEHTMLSFGMPTGPLALLDEIGLDISYKVSFMLESDFSGRMPVPQILKKAYEQKWFGKKTGKGFYVYHEKSQKSNPQIYNLISNKAALVLSNEEILKRMLYRMINEAVLCLQEKICNGSSDVDVGMIMGAGFPASKGGMLYYGDAIGLDKVTGDLESFRQRFQSERFSPCDYLVDLAKKKESFYK